SPFDRHDTTTIEKPACQRASLETIGQGRPVIRTLQVIVMARQDRSAGSNRHKLEPSSNSKHRADTKTGTSPGVNIDRLSPYVRLTARRGSKRTADGIGRSSPVTARVSSGASLILPKTDCFLQCNVRTSSARRHVLIPRSTLRYRRGEVLGRNNGG